MVPDHQVRRKWSGDASKKVQLFKVGGSRIIGTAVRLKKSEVTRPTILSQWSTYTYYVLNVER